MAINCGLKLNHRHLLDPCCNLIWQHTMVTTVSFWFGVGERQGRELPDFSVEIIQPCNGYALGLSLQQPAAEWVYNHRCSCKNEFDYRWEIILYESIWQSSLFPCTNISARLLYYSLSLREHLRVKSFTDFILFYF